MESQQKNIYDLPSNITELAYSYCKKYKKVSESNMETFKEAYARGIRFGLNKNDKEILEHLAKRYPSKNEIEYGLGMSDARRGMNDKEINVSKKREEIDSFINEFFKD